MSITSKVTLAAVGFCLGCFICFTPGFAQDKTVRLRYSIFLPPGHSTVVVVGEWCKEVEKRTNGRVVVKLYPGGTLTSIVQTYDSVAQGVVDVGFAASTSTVGKFPLFELLDYPLGYPNNAVAVNFANDFFKKFHPKEFDEVKVMYFDAQPPNLIHTKKPVKSLEDLKGMKIRTSGTSARFIQALGGVPVSVPMHESYDAISKGVAEGIVTSYESLKSWKLGEVVKFTTDNYATASTAAIMVIMNKAKWNIIKPEDQKIIEEINQEWIKKHIAAGARDDESGKAFSRARGNKSVTLSEKESVRWVAKAQPLFDGYVQSTNAKGLPGSEALKFARDYIKKNSK